MRQVMTAINLYPPIFLTYPLPQDAVKVVLFNERFQLNGIKFRTT